MTDFHIQKLYWTLEYENRITYFLQSSLDRSIFSPGCKRVDKMCDFGSTFFVSEKILEEYYITTWVSKYSYLN